MVDKHLSDSRLDEAIDRAVRDLMSVEPRTDLRARVLAELGGAPLRAALWPRLALASAALAVVIALVSTVYQSPADRRPEQTTVTALPPATPPPAPVAETPVVQTRPPQAVFVPGQRTIATSKPPDLQDRRIQAASIDTLEAPATEGPTPVARLRPVEPIALASLEPAAVSTPEIHIPPITVEQLDITLLTTRR